PPISRSRVTLDQTVALLACPHSVPAPTPVPRNSFSLYPPTRPARSLEAPLQFRPAQSLGALPPLPPHLFVDFPPINMNSIPEALLPHSSYNAPLGRDCHCRSPATFAHSAPSATNPITTSFLSSPLLFPLPPSGLSSLP